MPKGLSKKRPLDHNEEFAGKARKKINKLGANEKTVSGDMLDDNELKKAANTGLSDEMLAVLGLQNKEVTGRMGTGLGEMRSGVKEQDTEQYAQKESANTIEGFNELVKLARDNPTVMRLFEETKRPESESLDYAEDIVNRIIRTVRMIGGGSKDATSVYLSLFTANSLEEAVRNCCTDEKCFEKFLENEKFLPPVIGDKDRSKKAIPQGEQNIIKQIKQNDEDKKDREKTRKEAERKKKTDVRSKKVSNNRIESRNSEGGMAIALTGSESSEYTRLMDYCNTNKFAGSEITEAVNSLLEKKFANSNMIFSQNMKSDESSHALLLVRMVVQKNELLEEYNKIMNPIINEQMPTVQMYEYLKKLMDALFAKVDMEELRTLAVESGILLAK